MTFRTFRPGVILGYPLGQDLEGGQTDWTIWNPEDFSCPPDGDSGKPRIGGTPKTRFPDGLPDLGPGGETGKSGIWAENGNLARIREIWPRGGKFGPQGGVDPPWRDPGRGGDPLESWFGFLINPFAISAATNFL
jgi:hypothetical protein